MSSRFRYELWQNGMRVAAVDAPDDESALREIGHYAMMYSQDDPVPVRVRQTSPNRRWIALANRSEDGG